MHERTIHNALEKVIAIKTELESIAEELEREKGSPFVTKSNKEAIDRAINKIDATIYNLMEALGNCYQAHVYAKPFLQERDFDFSVVITKIGKL